jgi:hypothetical protein
MDELEHEKRFEPARWMRKAAEIATLKMMRRRRIKILEAHLEQKLEQRRVRNKHLEWLLAPMKRLGIPQTKAGYLFWWSLNNPLEFPLDADFEMTVPSELDGPLPQNWDEYFRMTSEW